MLGRVFRKVFGRGGDGAKSILFALFFACALLFLIVWLPNITLIRIVHESVIPAGEKFAFILSFFTSLPLTYGWPTAASLYLVVIIFGINGSLLLFYINQAGGLRREAHKSLLRQIGAVLASLLGVGCAACGTLFLAPVLGTAFSGYLLLLPFRGFEFSIIGLAVLIWSLYATAKRIDNPYV
ncbi:MAG TPA: hypothetical protein VI953_01600 [Candidatus Paceibacterota bacterium]